MIFIDLIHFVADFYFVFVMTATFIAAIIYAVIQLCKDKDKNEDEGLRNSGEAVDRKNNLFELRISHNAALGFVDTLSGALDEDLQCYSRECEGAIEGLRFYIAQNAKDDASQ